MVVEKLPQGMTCRAGADEIEVARPDWDPTPDWRGERSFRAWKGLQADKYRQWYHFDAEGKSVGWLSQAIAAVLRGKDNPLFDYKSDMGAYVVVTNCEKVRIKGKRYHYKLYFRNLSFRPGHLKVERFKDIQNRFPERIIMKAVWGSMAKTPENRRIFKDRLKLFVGPNHLYYNKDPVEYPMHTIPDVTRETELASGSTMLNKYKNRIPKMREINEAKEMIQASKNLVRYKEFLKNQLALEGESAQERLEMDELALAGERERMRATVEEYEGRDTPKNKVPVHIGTQIPKRKTKTHPNPGRGTPMSEYENLMAKKQTILGKQ